MVGNANAACIWLLAIRRQVPSIGAVRVGAIRFNVLVVRRCRTHGRLDGVSAGRVLVTVAVRLLVDLPQAEPEPMPGWLDPNDLERKLVAFAHDLLRKIGR